MHGHAIIGPERKCPVRVLINEAIYDERTFQSMNAGGVCAVIAELNRKAQPPVPPKELTSAGAEIEVGRTAIGLRTEWSLPVQVRLPKRHRSRAPLR